MPAKPAPPAVAASKAEAKSERKAAMVEQKGHEKKHEEKPAGVKPDKDGK